MTDFPHGGDVRGLARELGCAPEDILDFSASINPLGPPEWLRTTISSAVSSLVHYPDPHCRALVSAASARLSAPEEEIIAGNGTSELIFALARTCGHARAVIPVPAYRDYEEACLRAGMAVTRAPLPEERSFALDPAEISRAIAQAGGAALVFVARPNNPTGRDVPAETVRRLAAAHPDCLFAVDEAFGSFVRGFESLAAGRPGNVAVLASLTKMFAVPGLRLGLAVASPELARAVREGIAPWSVNALAQAVGERAMADEAFEERTRLAVTELRAHLAKGLAALPRITVYPGAANYLLCRLDAPGGAPGLKNALLQKRIAIRDCSNFAGLDERFFRVAVRARDDNERLLAAMGEILEGESSAAPAQAAPGPRASRKPIGGPRRKARPLMVQGTASNAGKSVLVAALCRILRQDGVRVAPFKAQNMSLNSHVTALGEEIGRAQALQARACGLAPQARMNPVLLKPCSDTGSQVIVMGRPVGNMRVMEYVAYKPRAFEAAKQAYDSLAGEFDAVVLEGAGSPAEVNLKSHDMVNMAMAAHAGAAVLLAGDIDRGGVFAALLGTMECLSESERALVGGYVLNRFRGDPALLAPAHRFMLETTGRPVLGVVPHIADLGLPEEDSVSFKAGACWSGNGPRDLDIAVIDLPHISNFTDFDALAAEPDVALRVVRRAGDLGRPDAVILPGSKNTLADLTALAESGLARAVAGLEGCEVVGVCAGLQMLGACLEDPLGLESGLGSREGLGLLPLTTRLEREKTLLLSRATHLPSGLALSGYEIHHGVTSATGPGAQVLAVGEGGRPLAWGRPGEAWGTYLHGVFDEHGFRRWWLNALRAKKGLAPLPARQGPGLDEALDRLAGIVRQSLDMKAVYALMGL